MKTLFLPVLLFGIVFLCACERDLNPFKPSEDFTYPLQVGNLWEYQSTYRYTVFHPFEGGMIGSDTTTTETVSVQILKEVTLHDSVKTMQMQEVRVNGFGTYSSETYYANEKSGLYVYAYRNPSGSLVAPKKAAGAGIVFNGRYFQNISEITRLLTQAIAGPASDSLIYENPPVLCLKFPVAVGSRWAYRHAGNFRIEKKIIAQEEVSVPAGTFSCYKIQWIYDVDKDLVWSNSFFFYDYVCEKGLIRRIFGIEGALAYDEDGNLLGPCHDTFDNQLTKLVVR
jgi:hypothetical protein